MKRKASTLEQLLQDFHDMLSRELNTCIPGIVEKKNSDNTVDVQPAIKRVYSDGKVVDLPLLVEVPVLYPFSSKLSMSWPLVKDDPVIVFFSQRSIENWRKSGGLVKPGDRRHHHLSDAFCMPAGAHVGAQTVDSAKFVLEYEGGKIEIDGSGNVNVNGSTDNAVAFQDLKTAFDNFIIEFNAHVHTSAAPGSSTTMPTVPSVASIDGAKVDSVRLP